MRGTWTASVVAVMVATLCSSVSLFALTTVLGKQVFDFTGRELDLGFLGLIEFAPAALLVLVTGSLADRLDRRRLGAAGELGEAAAAAGLAWYASTGATSVVPIFALVLGFGTARAFAAPPIRALLADVVPPETLPWITVRRSATGQVSAIAGPVIGGVLYTVDVSLPFVFVAMLLVIGAAALMFVRLHPSALAVPTEAAWTPAEVIGAATEEAALEPVTGVEAVPPARARFPEALQGLRFVRREPVLLGAISLDLFAVLFGGAVALLPAIAEKRLGVDAVGLGWLRAATGIGAALITLALAWRPLSRRVGRKLLVSVAVFGVATIALGLTTSFTVAFIALAVLSGADAVSVFIRATLVPLVTPPRMRGRVMAVENVFIGASNELGAFESGVAGQAFGPAAAVVIGGAATLVVAGTWWRRFPQLRDVDHFPGLATHPPSE